MKIFSLTVLIIIGLTVSGFSENSITLDRAEGTSNGKVRPNTPVVFHIGFKTDSALHGFSHHFRVYLSNNGLITDRQFGPLYTDYDNLIQWIPIIFHQFVVLAEVIFHSFAILII